MGPLKKLSYFWVLIAVLWIKSHVGADKLPVDEDSRIIMWKLIEIEQHMKEVDKRYTEHFIAQGLREQKLLQAMDDMRQKIQDLSTKQRDVKGEILSVGATVEDIHDKLQKATQNWAEKSTSRVTAVEELPMEDVVRSMKMYILCENQKIIDNFKRKSDEVVSLLNVTNLEVHLDTFKLEIKRSFTMNEEKLSKLTDLVRKTKLNENTTLVPTDIPPLTEKDCTDALEINSNNDVYRLKADFGSYNAYCMHNSDDGKGWTIIQRRLNGFIDFNRGWEEYKNGFGDPNGDYWLGLEKIHALTANKPHMFWFEMRGTNGIRRYSKYTRFEIGSEEEGYNLKKVEQYSGTFDNMLPNPGADNKFVTRDKNQDAVSSCKRVPINWWVNSCGWEYLNGHFGNVRDAFGQYEKNVFMAIRAV